MSLNKRLGGILAVGIALVFLGAPALAPAQGRAATQAAATDQLSMAAARSAARSVAWEVARRNPSVNSVKVGACRRQMSSRIFCLAVDRGSSSTHATTCRLRIEVNATHGEARGSLASVDCHNHFWPLLRSHEAEAAMRLWLQEAGLGNEASIDYLGRRSRVEIVGMATWARPSATNPSELCVVEMRVLLTEADEVQITGVKTRCVAP